MSASQHMRRLGQPIAYFPELAQMLGGVNASLFFSQIFYWLPKANSPDGVYKTAADITKETGMTAQEQRTARKKLVELGVLIETNKRIEHRLYFNLDLARFDELCLQHSGSEESTFAKSNSNIPEMQNQHSGSEESTFAKSNSNIPEMQNQHSGSEESTFVEMQFQRSYKEQENTKRLQQETTAGDFSARARETPAAVFADSDFSPNDERGENAPNGNHPPVDQPTAEPDSCAERESSTHRNQRTSQVGNVPRDANASQSRKAKFDPRSELLALGVDAQVAEDWLAVRRAKRAPLTRSALDGVVREAGKAGLSVGEAVRIAAERGWQGFKADWDWRSGGAPAGRVFDHAGSVLVSTGNSAVDLAQQQAARAADWLASLPCDEEGNLL